MIGRYCSNRHEHFHERDQQTAADLDRILDANEDRHGHSGLFSRIAHYVYGLRGGFYA